MPNTSPYHERLRKTCRASGSSIKWQHQDIWLRPALNNRRSDLWRGTLRTDCFSRGEIRSMVSLPITILLLCRARNRGFSGFAISAHARTPRRTLCLIGKFRFGCVRLLFLSCYWVLGSPGISFGFYGAVATSVEAKLVAMASCSLLKQRVKKLSFALQGIPSFAGWLLGQ